MCIYECCIMINFFLFKQKTAYEMRISDWSSDVCSSDLRVATRETRLVNFVTNRRGRLVRPLSVILVADGDLGTLIGSDENTRSTGRLLGIAPHRLSIPGRDPLRLELGIAYAVRFTIPNPDYPPAGDADPAGTGNTQ